MLGASCLSQSKLGAMGKKLALAAWDNRSGSAQNGWVTLDKFSKLL